MAVVNSGYSTQLMHLARCLFFIRAIYRFTLRAVYVPGRENVLANAISRTVLFTQVPEAVRRRCHVPRQAAGLELPSLVSTVSELFAASLAESTQRVYRSLAKRYEEFVEGSSSPPFRCRKTVSLCLRHICTWREWGQAQLRATSQQHATYKLH